MSCLRWLTSKCGICVFGTEHDAMELHQRNDAKPNGSSSNLRTREDSEFSRKMNNVSEEKENDPTSSGTSISKNREMEDTYQTSSVGSIIDFEDQRRTSRKYKLSDFRIIRELGRGKYGVVLLALDLELDQLIALKRIKTGSGKNQYDQFKNEIEIQGHIQHPNIIKLYGHFFENDTLHLVLECALHGSLYDTLITHGPLSEKAVAKYIGQLANALGHLHSHDVIHRDVKPENVLLSANGDVKLADFGWTVLSPQVESMTVCGTLDYLSPEMLQFTKHDHRVDVWSLGSLAFELLFGMAPFHEEDCLMTCKRIKDVIFSFPATPMISQVAKDFIAAILVRDPAARLSIDQIKQHPFITRSGLNPLSK